MSTRTQEIEISARMIAENMLLDSDIDQAYRADFMALLVPCIKNASFWDRDTELDDRAYEELDSIFGLFIQSDEVAYLEKTIQEDIHWATELEDELNSEDEEVF